MNREELFRRIQKKRSFLCVGLDTDLSKVPTHLHKSSDPVFEFNKGIIDATHTLAVAYKPNLAFYEVLGKRGWESLEKTVEYARSVDPGLFLIADAKRGDIGNTSAMYARTYFETMDFDAVTLSPYMGFDTVSPFLSYQDKWSVILALTSNKSASDFQNLEDQVNERKLFESVLTTAGKWGTEDQIMFVVGATQASSLEAVRKIVPGHFLLVPGIGAQGGSLSAVASRGMNKHCGLLVNSSRGIIYASKDEDFQEKAKTAARKIQLEMEGYLQKAGLLTDK